MGRNVGKWGISQFVSQLNAYIPILANECMGGPSDRGYVYIFWNAPYLCTPLTDDPAKCPNPKNPYEFWDYNPKSYTDFWD